MDATEINTIRIPVSAPAIEYAQRYCDFYDNASFVVGTEVIVITHQFPIDPTQSIFWPGNFN